MSRACFMRLRTRTLVVLQAFTVKVHLTDNISEIVQHKSHSFIHTQPFYALFRDHPGEPVPEEIFFWTLWCKGG